ncbi:MAG: carboxypeptidase regulatory-like domain-containing protein [Acidobacteriaceae bacterium]
MKTRKPFKFLHQSLGSPLMVALSILPVAGVISLVPAMGQTTSLSGAIQGSITDPGGAVVPGATITITNTGTKASRIFKTDNAGFYTSGPLIPGDYMVRVTAPGFRDVSATTIVQIGTTTSGNYKLALGEATQTVEVNSGEVQVATEQSNVQNVITQQQIQTLPINGRNFLDLAQLEPGVQLQSGGDFDPTKAGYSGLSFSGTSGRTTRILLDGQDITDETVGTTIFNVAEGAIGQFQIVRSTADVGNDLGSTGQVIVSSGSGTNSFHGNLFYNFQDYRAGFASANGSVSPFQRNQFGGSVGGPVIKDKLFFFANSERIKQDASTASLVTSLFPSVLAAAPQIPSPFRDTYSTARLDYSGPWNVHYFARINYEANAAVTNGGNGYWNYANRDNTPGIAGGADFVTGKFTHSFRGSYEKFHNLIVDSSGSSGYDPLGSFSFYLAAANLYSGPNANAPQQTYQSDKQFRYDGSWTKGAHNIRFGGSVNRILGGGFASFFGAGPRARLSSTSLVAGLDPSNPLNYHPTTIILGNGLGYFTNQAEFGAPAGGQGDWRSGAYIADSWKVRPNFTLNYGVRYQRDTGRSDADLAPIPCSQIDPTFTAPCTGNSSILDQFGAGLGNRVVQPNFSFGPQLGFAYSPGSNGKTVIRASIGRFFENSVFNNVLFDRPAKLASGLFNNYNPICGGVNTFNIPGQGSVNSINGVPISTLCAQPIGTSYKSFLALESQFASASKAAGAAANASYVGNTLSVGPGGFTAFSPNYKTPTSTQINFGVQQELFKGSVLSVDYVHSATIHIGQVLDANHVGDARFFDPAAAQAAVAATLAPTKANPAGYANVDAAIAAGLTIADFAGNGLDSGNNVNGGYSPQFAFGPGSPNTAAFPGQNPAMGQGLFQFPAGRAGYDALQANFRQQVAHPVRGIVSSNLEISYAYSKFVTTGGPNSTGNNSDVFFNSQSYDYNNPTRFSGFGGLDHRHNFSFGGSATIVHGPQVALIGHLTSAAPTDLTLDTTSGAPGLIYQTDWMGDGTVANNLVQGTNPGAYMRGVKGNNLNKLINNYNARYANTPTPAGQQLISNGIFTQAQLQALQGVQQPIQQAPSTAYQNPMFRQVDASVLYPIKLPFLGEATRLEPGVAVYNVANFGNYTIPSGFGNLINTTNYAQGEDRNFVNGMNSFDVKNSNRQTRLAGTYSAGTPRSIEYQLKFVF